jgi:hypothetical protein
VSMMWPRRASSVIERSGCFVHTVTNCRELRSSSAPANRPA